MKLASILLCLLALSACGGDPPTPPAPARHLCGPDAGYAVCSEGMSCREGKCWLHCKADADCPPGEYCDPGHFCAAARPTR